MALSIVCSRAAAFQARRMERQETARSTASRSTPELSPGWVWPVGSELRRGSVLAHLLRSAVPPQGSRATQAQVGRPVEPLTGSPGAARRHSTATGAPRSGATDQPRATQPRSHRPRHGAPAPRPATLRHRGTPRGVRLIAQARHARQPPERSRRTHRGRSVAQRRSLQRHLSASARHCQPPVRPAVSHSANTGLTADRVGTPEPFVRSGR
ncbi:uncharacterized protein V1510DRAFT_119398 [Dipodascopsis tothii]|uniref:uncharacterized protein n=1 Tax=Dipodascopsis tothii TaxID=44089 RepID=UPI0034CFE913